MVAADLPLHLHLVEEDSLTEKFSNSGRLGFAST